ncbi:MAG: molybdopterin biosynthesis protein [Clostridiales bacterium]|nr:molybdopterin biosynthesis protein [Clostridiales bacterium]
MKFDRNVYLSNIDLNEAKEKMLEKFALELYKPKTEILTVDDALDRITYKPVYARISSPYFNASAMDGISVIAKRTFGADERNPIALKINQDFIYVDTGDVIENPFDSVIMIEDVIYVDNERVKIIKAASPWQHIRPIGEDIVVSEMIVPSRHQINPFDIGSLLCGGITEIEVIKKPLIGILSTGTEIIEAEDKIEEGKIIDSNSRMFIAMTKKIGAKPNRYKPIIDDYELIKQRIVEATKENDIVVVIAGTSAGREDYISSIIKELGEIIVHGIAIKPGKPAIIGVINNKPIIGVPGYPVSAYIVFSQIVEPLIAEYLKTKEQKKEIVDAIISRRLVSSLKNLEFVRMKLGNVSGKLITTPLNRGAGVTMSLVKADGVAIINKETEGIEAGETIKIELLKDIDTINNTIVSIGSHDVIMDVIASLIAERNRQSSLSSAHVGSLGGIMAMKRGETHIAPIHLLDEKTGNYNTEYIKRYLKNQDVSIIKGVKREQGLMVAKGNPKKIKDVSDLVNDNIIFVNRQKGSGTRILLDYKIKELGLDSAKIIGYEREMTTHMMVASAVSSGSADVGLGIKSAAVAMGLEFVPVGEEEYDFVIHNEFLEEERIKNFIEILKSDCFASELKKLEGYSIENAGEIVAL